jgi:sulfite exporter TauE/SafE
MLSGVILRPSCDALGAAVGFAFATSSWSAILRLGTAVMVIVIGLGLRYDCAHALAALTRALGRVAVASSFPGAAYAAARRTAQAGPGDGTTVGMVALWTRLFGVGRRRPAGCAGAGALTMLGFGLGTLPAMSALSYASSAHASGAVGRT